MFHTSGYPEERLGLDPTTLTICPLREQNLSHYGQFVQAANQSETFAAAITADTIVAMNFGRGRKSRRLCSVSSACCGGVFSEVLFDAPRERPYPVRIHLSVLVKRDDLLCRQHKPHDFERRTVLSNHALANRDSLLLQSRQTGIELVQSHKPRPSPIKGGERRDTARPSPEPRSVSLNLAIHDPILNAANALRCSFRYMCGSLEK
jgi:hypothetical protein